MHARSFIEADHRNLRCCAQSAAPRFDVAIGVEAVQHYFEFCPAVAMLRLIAAWFDQLLCFPAAILTTCFAKNDVTYEHLPVGRVHLAGERYLCRRIGGLHFWPSLLPDHLVDEVAGLVVGFGDGGLVGRRP